MQCSLLKLENQKEKEGTLPNDIIYIGTEIKLRFKIRHLSLSSQKRHSSILAMPSKVCPEKEEFSDFWRWYVEKEGKCVIQEISSNLGPKPGQHLYRLQLVLHLKDQRNVYHLSLPQQQYHLVFSQPHFLRRETEISMILTSFFWSKLCM